MKTYSRSKPVQEKDGIKPWDKMLDKWVTDEPGRFYIVLQLTRVQGANKFFGIDLESIPPLSEW